MRSGRRTTCPPGGKASQTNQACQCRPPLPGDGLARAAVVSQEIANRPKVEFPREAKMGLSHETIYQSLFVQGRGELKRELARCLRSVRTKRRP